MMQVKKAINMILKSDTFEKDLLEQYYDTLFEYKSLIIKNFI